MGRGSRIRIMLGAAIICIIGVMTGLKWLSLLAFVLVVLSCLRLKEKPPTNYTEIYGPPEKDKEQQEPLTPFNTKIDPKEIE